WQRGEPARKGREGGAQAGVWDHGIFYPPPRRCRVRSLTQALDRRTHLCLAQSFSTLGTRFRALRQNCRRLHPPRHDPDHAEAACGKPLVMNPNFVDGLLGMLNTRDPRRRLRRFGYWGNLCDAPWAYRSLFADLLRRAVASVGLAKVLDPKEREWPSELIRCRCEPGRQTKWRRIRLVMI